MLPPPERQVSSQPLASQAYETPALIAAFLPSIQNTFGAGGNCCGVSKSFDSHAKMLDEVRPDIDNIACANYAHGPYTIEAAPQGTSFPRPNQFYSHGYVNEINDAVDCALNESQFPQSGSMMAWDTMAVLMAGYESAEKESGFIDVTEYTRRPFNEREYPNPATFGSVFQRT